MSTRCGICQSFPTSRTSVVVTPGSSDPTGA
jgi:hypothetical protein